MTNIDKTLLIQTGRMCPYCNRKTIYTDSSIIYGKSYGMIYLCKLCQAYVGCHKNSNRALGRLANAELRHWKKQAHLYFDKLWKDGHEKRSNVYGYLARFLELPPEQTHIGLFDIELCKATVDWSKMILNDLRRLDLDCGIDTKQPYYER